MLSRRPQGVNQIGEWSLDKRHYGGAYPPRGLQLPPSSASDGAHWLTAAWNEASAAIATWPATRALGTIGWRRVAGDGIDGSRLAQRVLQTKWKWANIAGLQFQPAGALKTPWGVGAWGVFKQPAGVAAHAAVAAAEDVEDGIMRCSECLFADFGNAQHNLRFYFNETPPRFLSHRIGDGFNVEGLADA